MQDGSRCQQLCVQYYNELNYVLCLTQLSFVLLLLLVTSFGLNRLSSDQ